MQTKFYAEIRRCLSEERLEAYRHRRTDDDLDLLARYFYNIALCESLYPALNLLEVALRNSLYEGFSRTFHPRWLYASPQPILLQWQRDLVKMAQQELIKQNKRYTGGTLIAELNFGFWSGFFNANYEKTWHKLFRDTTLFPALPKQLRKRKTLSVRFNRIRYLRNRVFHHEPIWQWSNIGQRHGELLEAIYWINPMLREIADLVDRFPEVYRQGTIVHYHQLDLFLGESGYI